jgi:hypothetical protein
MELFKEAAFLVLVTLCSIYLAVVLLEKAADQSIRADFYKECVSSNTAPGAEPAKQVEFLCWANIVRK